MTLLAWALVAVVAMSVGATLLARGTVALMGRFGGEAMQRMMLDTEYIVEHRTVPPAWQSRIAKRLGDLGPGGADSPQRDQRRARAKRECLRELDRLLAFAKKSSVVADEETRGILLEELARVAAEWRDMGWDAMCALGTGSRPRGSPRMG